jgi:hypothetical protein
VDQVHQEATWFCHQNLFQMQVDIMGLMVAMAKASAIPNIHLSQVKTKDLDKDFKRIEDRMGC